MNLALSMAVAFKKWYSIEIMLVAALPSVSVGLIDNKIIDLLEIQCLKIEITNYICKHMYVFMHCFLTA